MANLDLSCILLIRHLPADLNRAEKEDMLRHFGAQRVKVMGDKGPMQHTAFATFSDVDSAKEVMAILHQMEISDNKLVVEFARKSQQKHFPSFMDNKHLKENKNSNDTNNKQETQENKSADDTVLQSLPSVDSTFTKWSVQYPRNPDLYYVYPPPTAAIITNIAHSIAAHPKLYTQVLHLMNKMNLPAPFGGMSAVPPIPTGQLPGQPEHKESSDESEIESDGESSKDVFGEHRTKKRPSSSTVRRPIKVARLLTDPEPWRVKKQGTVLSTQDAFEQSFSNQGQKRIQLKIPEAVTMETTFVAPVQESQGQLLTTRLQHQGYTTPRLKSTFRKFFGRQHDIVGLYEKSASENQQNKEHTSDDLTGFGKMQPVEKSKEETELSESLLPYTVDPALFICQENINKGRVKDNELQNFSVFKRYNAGEPTTRLYVKNLAKPTTEQDLVNIYGRYVDWTSELEKNVFDIRLMKEGRMKGQAFVTLPTDGAASEALKNTNAYVIHGKPMVVQFARSAKAQE